MRHFCLFVVSLFVLAFVGCGQGEEQLMTTETLVFRDFTPPAGTNTIKPVVNGETMMTFTIYNPGPEDVVIDSLELLEEFHGEFDQSVSVAWSGSGSQGNLNILGYWGKADPSRSFHGDHRIRPLFTAKVTITPGAEVGFSVNYRFGGGSKDVSPNWHKGSLHAATWHTVSGTFFRKEFSPPLEAGTTTAQ